MIELDDINNILIINTAFLGDVALSVYLCDKVKMLYPNVKLSFITTPQAAPLVNTFESVDNIVAFDKRNSHRGLKGLNMIADRFKDTQPDIIIAPHRSFRTSYLANRLSSGCSIGFKSSSLSFLYKIKVQYKPHLHEINRNLSLLTPLFDRTFTYDNEKAALAFTEEDKNYVHNLVLNNKLYDFVCIAPGSVWETKKWKKYHFYELVKLIAQNGKKSVLIGGGNDYKLCEEIKSNDNAVNLAGKLTIPQSLFLMTYAKAIISNDSAPTHFGGLTGTPVVTIFGPTISEFGFAPHGENDIIAEVEGLKCRPCAIHGGNKCPIGTHECMVKITPEYVLSLLEKIWNKNR